MREKKRRDAEVATFTWIFGFQGLLPRQLFLIASVQFISLFFWGLSRGICSKAANYNCGVWPPVSHVLLNTMTLGKFTDD